MKAQLQSIHAQWQANQRLRLGVWAIIAAILLLLLLNLRDFREKQEQLLANVIEKNMQTKTVAADRQWLQRRDQFADLRTQALATLPKAKTVGLAQADIRVLVNSILQEEKITVEIINIGTPQPAPPLPECYSVPVALHGTIPLHQLFSLLYRLESAKYTVFIDSFVLRPNERQSFSLECQFFVLLDAP